jgi:hypothetical protein
VTTIVRPSEADLSAIARRISGPLSPEGAEAWYRNDSAMLLQEIATLRQEAATARQSFFSDGAQAGPDATLYELAKAWKATSTGYWEKTQTRRLRQKVAELTDDAENLRASIQTMREEYERNVQVLSAQYAAREAQAKDLMARAAELL